MVAIPEKARYLVAWDTKSFASLAVVLRDGTPQVSPVWFDWDGSHVIINTARGRVKDRALRRGGRVALVIADPRDQYKYMLIRGQVDSETEDGAYEMICKLNEKYRGKYGYPRVPGQVRVTYTIAPEHVFVALE